MASSLQEQLLKAGLVTADDVAEAEAHLDRRQGRRDGARRGEGRRDEVGKGRSRSGRKARGGARDARGERGRDGAQRERGAGNGSQAGDGAGKRRRGGRRRNAASSETPAPGQLQARAESIADVGLRAAKRRTEELIKDGKLRSHSPEKREREVRRQRILRIITRDRQDDAAADVPHNFVRGTRIKRIYFTASQREQFLNGELIVVGFEGRYSVVSRSTGAELLEIDPDLFVHRHGDADGSPESGQLDEEGYPPVPDDLVW